MQVRVRLVNCPFIPYRFQWVSGGKSISGDPTVHTDKENCWALYKRVNDSGMLITAQSGRILGKVEKNMRNPEEAELQTIFNYDSADNHSIIIDFYSHEEDSSICIGGGLMERAFREFKKVSI